MPLNNPIPAGRQVPLGKATLTFGKTIVELCDSSPELNDIPTLRRRLEDEGHLLLRNFYPRQEVLAARQEIVDLLAEMHCLAPDTPTLDAVINTDEAGRIVDTGQYPQSLLNYDDGNKSKTILFKREALQKRFVKYTQLVGSRRFLDFFEKLMGGDAELRAFNSIPRAVPTGEFTGAHYDIVYFGPHNDHVFTCWMPLGDVPIEQGPLALLLNSHNFEQVRKTYGKMYVVRDNTEGWFSTDPIEMVEKFGGMWATTNFNAGDLVLFSMYFMHGSVNNTTTRYRISSDARYQLKINAREEPKVQTSTPQRSMHEARKQWGL